MIDLTAIAAKRDIMVQTLIDWCNTNSGSYHHNGLAQMRDKIAALFVQLGAEMQVMPAKSHQTVNDLGEIIEHTSAPSLRFFKRPQATKKIVLCGHMDTVFAAENSFQQCQYLDDNTINGPGVADMKGGLLVMFYALQSLEQSASAAKLGWEVLIVADEEIGSLGSTAHLEQVAKGCDYGLIYEPSMADGSFAGARKGSGLFSLVVQGTTAHAGRDPHLGRNAIHKLSEAIVQIVSTVNQCDGLTVNPGRIAGGGPLNQIAERAVCHFNFRCFDKKQADFARQLLQQIVADINAQQGYSATIHGSFHRPPKPFNAKKSALAQIVKHCCSELQLNYRFVDTGGCCDGNNLAQYGVENIDTLGVRGGKIHTNEEFILLDSLVERVQLSALILHQITQKIV